MNKILKIEHYSASGNVGNQGIALTENKVVYLGLYAISERIRYNPKIHGQCYVSRTDLKKLLRDQLGLLPQSKQGWRLRHSGIHIQIGCCTFEDRNYLELRKWITQTKKKRKTS
jgi:hypothetical protein